MNKIFFLGVMMSCLWANAQVNYEFRGVWIASVENIDWPSKKGLSVADQKAEYIKILDGHLRNGMNAVIVQIRPAADAFYPSQYEPWSEYLNGVQGLPPTPYYDPLEFMITETHKRGMEFHAWLNPYRAVFNMAKSTIAPTHVTKLHPEWFLVYGDKKYFNPGLPEVRTFVNNVVKDIVTRYDIDAIHMDDYFYPYRIAGKEFPDQKDFEKYGNGLGKDDWRRSNCDSIIYTLSNTIKLANKRVKFGISPFGVWRNKSADPMGSNTKAGQTNYDDLYADILLWLQKGWIDYVVPQLYWERGHKLCDYDVLLDWWNQNSYGKHIYVGHGIYRANTNEAWKNKNEIPNQIKQLRQYPTTHGSAYFSSKTFDKNPNGWNDSLRNNYYALPALVPPMPWIDDALPDTAIVAKTGSTFSFSYKGKKAIKGYVIYAVAPMLQPNIQYATTTNILIGTTINNFNISSTNAPLDNRLFVATVDNNNNTSAWVELK